MVKLLLAFMAVRQNSWGQPVGLDDVYMQAIAPGLGWDGLAGVRPWLG